MVSLHAIESYTNYNINNFLTFKCVPSWMTIGDCKQFRKKWVMSLSEDCNCHNFCIWSLWKWSFFFSITMEKLIQRLISKNTNLLLVLLRTRKCWREFIRLQKKKKTWDVSRWLMFSFVCNPLWSILFWH